MPGSDSPDFAAVHILADVLTSQRGNLYGLVPQGKALGAEFGLAETFPRASVAYSALALPADSDPGPVTEEMHKIIYEYAAHGVPPELVEAARRAEVADREFERNSIPGLAETWSQALAAEGRNSPDELVEAMKSVTVEDVNRVAKTYLTLENSITAQLKPVPAGGPVSNTMKISRRRPVRRVSKPFSTNCSPTARKRWTAWPFRKRLTTSPRA